MKMPLLLSSCILLVACAQPPAPETVEICNSAGCVERPRDYASYDPATAVPATDSDGRIAALKQQAASDPRAAYDLALRFFRGDGVPQDSYQALVWMRKAAEQGDLQAQKALGRLYLTGLEEMGSDPQEAEKWLMIAASRGDQEAEELLTEASEAKQSEDYYRRWRNRWRGVFYDNWYSGYPYRSYWHRGSWYYR